VNTANNICYWCGTPATSKEHVPPRNLFPKGKNKDLITVPSCTEHNQAFGKIDEKFRVYLQARETSSDALSEFKTRTIRGLTRPESAGFVKGVASGFTRVNLGRVQTIALKVNPSEQNLYFEKIIRGLYFHIYGHPTTGRVGSVSKDFLDLSFDYKGLSETLIPYFNDPRIFKEGEVANPDIFRFRYIEADFSNRKAFAVALLFYQGVEVIGIITPDAT
jgi:hypothetical protein